MNKEKSIRQQAKASLRDSWAVAIAGLLTVFASFLASFLLFALLYTISDASGLLSLSGGNFFAILIIVISLVSLFMLSPLINGFQRICYKISVDSEVDFSEEFYFFSSTKSYLSAIHFNAIILLKKFAFFAVALFPFIILCVLRSGTTLNFLSDDAFNVLFCVLLTLGIAAGILLTVKYLFSEFVFASGELGTIDEVFEISNLIQKKHSRDIRRLVYTFAGWIALCFFVVPVFYVAPYLYTSAATSSKWLFSLYKAGKMV